MTISLGTVVTSPVSGSVTGSFTAARPMLLAIIWEGPGDGTNNMTLNTPTVTGETVVLFGSKHVNTNYNRRPAIQFATVANPSTTQSKTTAVTFSGGTPANYSIKALEFIGADTAAPFYNENYAVRVAAELPSVDITTSNDNDAIVVLLNSDQSSQPAVSGYTSFFASAALYGGYVDGYRNLDVGAAGTKTISAAAGGVWLMKGIAVKAAGGGGGPALMGQACL